MSVESNGFSLSISIQDCVENLLDFHCVSVSGIGFCSHFVVFHEWRAPSHHALMVSRFNISKELKRDFRR